MDSFLSVVPIAQNLSNQGLYKWKVPDIVSKKVKIRVRDTKRPQVFSATVQPLKVQGALEFRSPQGEEFWAAGTSHSLVWQTTGSISTVTLEYSTDDFVTALPISVGVRNEGRFQWRIPDMNADHLKFRVSDAQDGSVYNISKPIQIGGTIKLISPNGGEVWRIGEEASIEWKTTGAIPKVRIELSSDRFSTQPEVIQPSVANTGSYHWIVPEKNSDQFQIRISDAAHPNISDQSHAAFKIVGTLNFLSPRGGEVWPVGSSQTIEWRSRGQIPFLRLEYSKDHFATAVPIETQLTNTGKYTWKIPDLAGEKIQLRLTDIKEPSVSTATIYEVEVQPVLELTHPAGGEVWQAKETKPIAWATIGTLPHVNLEYSLDDFQTVESIAQFVPNTGSYLWNVPDMSTKNLKIRIADASDPSLQNTLQLPLQIQGNIRLTSPVGGEIWLVGTKHPITWTSTGNIDGIRIEYSTDDFATSAPVAIHIANQGSYEWTVPDTISKNVKVRVIHDQDGTLLSETPQPFEIRGGITLLSPTGGEQWTLGSRYAISWQTLGTISHVKLEYSTDDFMNDIRIIGNELENKGIYYWDIPMIPSPTIRVRVLDAQQHEIFDVSKFDILIQGEIRLLSPKGGESYEVGERMEILWRATPNIGNVKLEYSADNFESTKLISDYIPNTGKFIWNAPDIISDNLRVRVSDAANAAVFSYSKIPFRTHGGLTLLRPRGGETWPAGSKQNIQWDTNGAIERIRLEFSSDNFKTSLPIVTSIENKGNYEWVIPEVPYSQIRIRVIAADTPSVIATSQGDVQIVGQVEMVSPSGGEKWVVGEDRIIRWATKGYIALVDLEYSKDDFNRDVHLIAAKIPNGGNYSWHIPNDPSSEIKIRLKDSTTGKILAVMNNPLQIGFYQTRWIVRDAETKDYLSGLVLTESTGKTISQLGSPILLEYPYGIYTSVWTKPGYGEFRTTWLANQDQTFEVLINPKSEKLEMVRATFDYDREKDLVKIQTWYEKEGKVIPAVIQAEVKIYKGVEPIRTFTSSTPDPQGHFRMIWDTSTMEGNQKYLAAVSITEASGKIFTSPISYQIALPVKEKRAAVLHRAVPSMFLKPIGTAERYQKAIEAIKVPKLEPFTKSASMTKQMLQKMNEKAPEPLQRDLSIKDSSSIENQMTQAMLDEETQTLDKNAFSNLTPASPVKKVSETPPPTVPALLMPGELRVPPSAVLNETISITYTGASNAQPVLDLYDTNRKLVLRGQPLNPTGQPGTFSYLLRISGLEFIPGKSVKVSVVDLKSGTFKSAEMRIETTPSALGYDAPIGGQSVLEVLSILDSIKHELRDLENHPEKFSQGLSSVSKNLLKLAGLLSESSINPKILDKLNEVSETLARLAVHKGYDAGFLVANPLSSQSGLVDVNQKLNDFKSVLRSLEKLDYYSSGIHGAKV